MMQIEIPCDHSGCEATLSRDGRHLNSRQTLKMAEDAGWHISDCAQICPAHAHLWRGRGKA